MDSELIARAEAPTVTLADLEDLDRYDDWSEQPVPVSGWYVLAECEIEEYYDSVYVLGPIEIAEVVWLEASTAFPPARLDRWYGPLRAAERE